MAKEYYYAYWMMVSPSDSSKLIKCIRGPKDNISDLNAEIQHIYSGHYEIITLPYRDPQRAKGIITDKMAQSNGLDDALGKVSWKPPRLPTGNTSARLPIPRE